MVRRAIFLLVSIAAAIIGFSSFRLLESHLYSEVYRARLEELSADYENLRQIYEEAVRRTAVTELLVTEDSVTVVIRTADGELRSIATPFDPKREIYVDYVVLNGRLWIRRLFDDSTPPARGMLIDPELDSIDWNADGASHGKAAYRSLSPGRWVVDVTGDGSLGMTLQDENDWVELAPAPPVRRYDQVEFVVKDALETIGPYEAVTTVVRQFESGP
jgi:hypothetical protein